MHFVKNVSYVADYKLLLKFEDDSTRLIDLEHELDGEIFEPLKEIDFFKTVRVDTELDTIVWENGADFAPEFLYDNSVPISASERAA